MSSAGEALTTGAFTIVGTVVGTAFGSPGLGMSVGYNVGQGVWSMANQNSGGGGEGSSSTYSLGPIDLTKSHRLPVPVVYGKHLVSGNVIYEDIYGDDDQKLDIQVAVSEGPIESISNIKANDTNISATTRLGTRDQSDTTENSGSYHPYTAYISASLDAEEMELSGSPTISSIVKGRKIEVWDSLNEEWAVEYSNNPAYALMDFLTNDRYGMGIDENLIDKNSFAAVGEWCDEDVNGEPRYTLNMVLDRTASSLDIIQRMLQSFQAFLIYSNGQLRLKADTVEDSTAQVFDMSNIVEGSFSYEQVTGEDVPNRVRAEYVEPDEGWQMVEAFYSNDSDIRDRGKTIEHNLQFQGVTSFDQAGRLTRIYHNKAYFNRFVATWKAGIDSLHCEVGDVVEVSHDLPDWSNQEFRIMEIREQENDEMQIVAQEYNEQVFTDEGVEYQPPEGPSLPNPAEEPPHVENASAIEQRYDAKDGTAYSTLLLEWERPTDYPFYKRTNIYLRPSGETWDSSPIGNPTGTFYETGQISTGDYEVKFVAENRNGITADFSTAPTVSITVEGKQAKPSDTTFVAGSFQNTINLRWNPVSDADLDYYEVRTDTNFGNATDAMVYRGDNNKIQLDEFPVGDQTSGTRNYTFYVKAANQSGLYSNNYDSITVSNPAPQPPSLVITEFFEKLWVEIDPPADDSINGYEIEIDGTVFDISVGERLSYNAESATTYDIRARSYDIIGPGDWSSTYTASTKDIDSVAQYASSLRPAEIVETLPSLPNDDYPPGTWVTKIYTDGSGNITDVELYENVSDSWDGPKDPDFSAGDAVWPRVIAGTIQAGAISTDELAANAVRAEEIASDTITAAEIAGKTITADEIAAGTITANEIDANTITANEIAAGTITATEIDANTITADQIASDTITASEIDADTITATEIATGTITADELDADSVTATEINVSQLSAINADMGTLNAGLIQLESGKIEIGDNVLGSGLHGILVNDGVDDRVRIGELSSGVYGLQATDSQGRTVFNASGEFMGQGVYLDMDEDTNSGTPLDLEITNLPQYDIYILRLEMMRSSLDESNFGSRIEVSMRAKHDSTEDDSNNYFWQYTGGVDYGPTNQWGDIANLGYQSKGAQYQFGQVTLTGRPTINSTFEPGCYYTFSAPGDQNDGQAKLNVEYSYINGFHISTGFAEADKNGNAKGKVVVWGVDYLSS